MTVPKFTGANLPAGSVGSRQQRFNPSTRVAVPPIQHNRFARNGQHPSAQAMNALHEACNQAALYRTKTVYSKAGGIGFGDGTGMLDSNGAGSRSRAYFAFHSGPYCHALMVRLLQANPNTAPYDLNAYVEIDIYSDTAMSTLVASTKFEFGAAILKAGGTPAGGWPSLRSMDKYITGLSPDTAYYGLIKDVDNGRFVAASLIECPSLTENFSGYLPQNLSEQSLVLDVYREKQSSLLKALWKHAGSVLFHYGNDDGSSQNYALGTYKNVIDLTSTAPGSSTPGFTLDLTGHDRLAQTTGVPCVLKVYAAGAGDIELVNSSGTQVALISGGWAFAPTWQSVAFNLPATSDKYDLRMRGSGGSALQVYGVSCYEYET